MKFDHVAIPSNDISASVRWYQDHFAAEVLYQDSTWAFLKIGGQKVALVSPQQHPPHLAVSADEDELRRAAEQHKVPIDSHRDGTCGIYIYDPFGNAVELIHYPKAQTIYDKQ